MSHNTCTEFLGNSSQVSATGKFSNIAYYKSMLLIPHWEPIYLVVTTQFLNGHKLIMPSLSYLFWYVPQSNRNIISLNNLYYDFVIVLIHSNTLYTIYNSIYNFIHVQNIWTKYVYCQGSLRANLTRYLRNKSLPSNEYIVDAHYIYYNTCSM